MPASQHALYITACTYITTCTLHHCMYLFHYMHFTSLHVSTSLHVPYITTYTYHTSVHVPYVTIHHCMSCCCDSCIPPCTEGLRRRRKKDSVLPVSSSTFRREFAEDCQPLQDEPTDVRTRWVQIKEATSRIFSYCLMR